MKIFQWIFDAVILVLLCLVLYQIFDDYYGEPQPEWENPFQNLPWQEFKSIEFPSQNYSILMQESYPTLKIANRSWKLKLEKIQKYLDNWLILPKFEAQPAIQDSNYGFSEKPDLKMQFNDQILNIHLGRSVPGMEGSFYVSTSTQTIFTLPSALRSNLLWKPEHFLPRQPFKNGPRMINLPKNLMGRSLQLNLSGNNIWEFTGKKLYHKPRKIIDRLSQIKLEPTLNIEVLGKKLTTIGWDQQIIHIHESGFYDPEFNLGWVHTKASQRWLQELKLEWISPYLKDHEPFLNEEINKLQYSDGKILGPKNSIFGFYLKKLQQFTGEVVKQLPPIPFEVFSVQCSDAKQNLMISGLKNDRFIAFSISEDLYLINSAKSVLP